MSSKIFYWIPRVLTILSLIFMAMFSLDSIGANIPLGRKILGLIIHNIPVLILTLFLIIAWKKEVAGGILLVLAAVAGMLYFRSFSGNPGSLVVISPFLIEGVLFIFYGVVFRKRAARL